MGAYAVSLGACTRPAGTSPAPQALPASPTYSYTIQAPGPQATKPTLSATAALPGSGPLLRS